MKGFEIKINSKEPIIVASDKTVCVFIDTETVCMNGSDSKAHQLRWFDEQLKIGDKIKIKVVETDESSLVKKRIPINRNELKEKYYKLKKELENNGLI